MLADEWSYNLRDEYSCLPDSTGGAPGKEGKRREGGKRRKVEGRRKRKGGRRRGERRERRKERREGRRCTRQYDIQEQVRVRGCAYWRRRGRKGWREVGECASSRAVG